MTEAKLLIAPGCPHCATMMSLLGDLLKEGRIASLLMVNIAEQPDEATKHNVRCAVAKTGRDGITWGTVTRRIRKSY